MAAHRSIASGARDQAIRDRPAGATVRRTVWTTRSSAERATSGSAVRRHSQIRSRVSGRHACAAQRLRGRAHAPQRLHRPCRQRPDEGQLAARASARSRLARSIWAYV